MMNCAYYMSNRVIVIRLVKIKAAGLGRRGWYGPT